MQFYIKTEAGDYKEVDDKEFGSIFGERIERVRQQESEKIRAELGDKYKKEITEQFTPELTKTLTEKLTTELSEKIKGEYDGKLKEIEKNANTLQVQLRQKTIAAEYGFKPDLESFLGEGTEEEMRAKADILKTNAGVVSKGETPPAKETKQPGATTGFVTKIA